MKFWKTRDFPESLEQIVIDFMLPTVLVTGMLKSRVASRGASTKDLIPSAPGPDLNYSVFHGIGNQEQGCCELVLGFQKAQGASL